MSAHTYGHACYYHWQMACARGCHKHVPLYKGTQPAGLLSCSAERWTPQAPNQSAAGCRSQLHAAESGAPAAAAGMPPPLLPGTAALQPILRQAGAHTRQPADPGRTAPVGAQAGLEAVNLDQSLLCELVVHLHATEVGISVAAQLPSSLPSPEASSDSPQGQGHKKRRRLGRRQDVRGLQPPADDASAFVQYPESNLAQCWLPGVIFASTTLC